MGTIRRNEHIGIWLCLRHNPLFLIVNRIEGIAATLPVQAKERAMYDINSASVEQLRAIARAALALSTIMVETEELINDRRSSFEVEEQWSELTSVFQSIWKG